MVAYNNSAHVARGAPNLPTAGSATGSPFPGATDTIYTPKPADLGHTLTFRVTGTPGRLCDTTLESKPIIVAPGTLPDPGLDRDGHREGRDIPC